MVWTRLANIDSYITHNFGTDAGYQFFTIFDAALLIDTNWYASVDTSLVIPTFWGYGKGCEFLENPCDQIIHVPYIYNSNDSGPSLNFCRHNGHYISNSL